MPKRIVTGQFGAIKFIFLSLVLRSECLLGL